MPYLTVAEELEVSSTTQATVVQAVLMQREPITRVDRANTSSAVAVLAAHIRIIAVVVVKVGITEESIMDKEPKEVLIVRTEGPRNSSTVEECAVEALRIARFCGQIIGFTFEGTEILVDPTDLVHEIVERVKIHKFNRGDYDACVRNSSRTDVDA